MKLYQFGNYLHNKKIPILPKIINGFIRIIHNCAIYSETEIGKGTQFGYGGIGVVIHKHSVIGDNVYIATGAKILGDIRIGSNSVIGANAVVITDVPENSVVAGVLAKVIK